MFKVREQVGLQELELEYDALAPEGSPEVEKETDCAEPELKVAVTTLLTDSPRVTDMLPPWAREKSNVELEGVVLQASGVNAELPAELNARTL